MKDKIIALIGESGSGKSTIAGLLERVGYNYIQSYTTRAKRYEHEKGHIFIEDGIPCRDFEIKDNRIVPKENVIAYTFFDNNHYWATKEQYQNKGNSIYIVDPSGVNELRETVKDVEIVAIYLKVDEAVRYKRMCRSRLADDVTSRIEHDKEAFRIVPCDYVVDANSNMEKILEDIKKIIKECV